MDVSPLGLFKAFSYGILVPLFAYTELSGELVTILFILIGFDVFTAVIRELLFGEFKSRVLWTGVASKCILIIVPYTLIFVGKGAGVDMSPIAKLALSSFIVAEGYSVLGNIVQIREKDKSMTEQDAITFVLHKAQDIIRKFLDYLMSTQ